MHKPIIKKFEKIKVYSSFKDNIWGADFSEMQLISKFDERICFFLCFINIFSKYALVVRLKDKKATTVTNAFQNILHECKRQPNKIWVNKNKGSEFYNRSMKSWLHW